jgi:hypothetical protein
MFSVFVPESDDDSIYRASRLRTSVNLCQNYDRNQFKQKILFNFNSTASDDGCPAKIVSKKIKKNLFRFKKNENVEAKFYKNRLKNSKYKNNFKEIKIEIFFMI